MLINKFTVFIFRFLSAFVLGFCFLLSGCSTLNNYVNREIQENQVEADKAGYQGSIMGMTAARRGIVIRASSPEEIKKGRPTLVFCAEPPPDAIQSINSVFETSLKNKSGEGSVTDKYATAVAGIAARTPISETYRTAVFSLCQFNINGSISDEQTATLFGTITTQAFSALNAAAGKEQAAPASSVNANAGGSDEAKKAPVKEKE